MISRPSFGSQAPPVEGGDGNPVATSRVMAISEKPWRSSANMLGRISRLGTGGYGLEIMIVQVFLPWQAPERRGESMGSAMAFFTMSEPEPSASAPQCGR